MADIAAKQAELEATKQEAVALGKRIAAVTDRSGAAKEHRSGLLSRQKLLKDLEARREGVSEGVKSVLRQRDKRFPFVRGLVADVLRVDVEHAHVIEAALDGRDQWLVTDDEPAAVAAAGPLSDLEGRVNVVCADRLLAATVVDARRHCRRPCGGCGAADAVRPRVPGTGTAGGSGWRSTWSGSSRPTRFGGRRGCSGTPSSSTTCRRRWTCTASGPPGFRYVTRPGEVIEADGTLRAGPLTAAMGLLSRRSELDAVRAAGGRGRRPDRTADPS